MKVKFEPVICGGVSDHFTADPRKIRVRGAMFHPWPPHHDLAATHPFWYLLMSDTPCKVLEINGVRYVPEHAAGPAALPVGNRAVFVLDRGFIYAGDWDLSDEGYTLANAVNLRRYESVGFEGVLADPKSSKATIVAMPYPVIVPAGSVLFRIPVDQGWGL